MNYDILGLYLCYNKGYKYGGDSMTDQQMDQLFDRLSHSKFRSRFHLKDKDIQYIDAKGMDTIRSHAYDFINKRLAPEKIINDGKQTPMCGHPVFIAQHATATCCRGCLYKWYHIEAGYQLTPQQVDDIVEVIMHWIVKEYQRAKGVVL